MSGLKQESYVDFHRLTRWLTLGANAGVLIGLILLIMELDQNREMMRAQTRHELAMGIVDLLQTPATNEQLASLMYRAQAGEKLTPTETFQFQLRTNALFRYWENVHYQYRVGLYDDIEFARQRDAWRASLNKSRPGQGYWCQVRTLYSPEFMTEMDRLIDHACEKGTAPMTTDQLKQFARQYTAAWNSDVPENVSNHFAEGATLSVNGDPATGREAITAVALSFMTGFPDMELTMDTLVIKEDTIEYHWTFAGTNTGPGGTGNAVRFSGFEEWTMGDSGLISQSVGQFDQEEFEHQLEHGVGPGQP